MWYVPAAARGRDVESSNAQRNAATQLAAACSCFRRAEAVPACKETINDVGHARGLAEHCETVEHWHGERT